MKQRSSRNAVIIGICMIISSALLVGGVAYANGASITACVKKSNGATRIISGKMKCTKSERQVTWGQTGTTGATGPQGAQGPTGPQGPAGQDGVTKLYYKTGERIEVELPFDDPEISQVVLSGEVPAGLNHLSFSGLFVYQALLEEVNGNPDPTYIPFPLAIGCVLTTGTTYSPGQTSDVLSPPVTDPMNFFPYMIQINPVSVGISGPDNTTTYSFMDSLSFNTPIHLEYPTTLNVVCAFVNPKASDIFSLPNYRELIAINNAQFIVTKVNELDTL